MTKLDFFEKIRRPEGKGIRGLTGALYRLVSLIQRNYFKNLNETKLSLNKEKREHILTCSLTSFPDRINTVAQTIKSLMHQSLKPDRVILWLAKEEFQGKELPESIKKLEQIGLEIRYCENYFGHKRYYKLIEEQKPTELIILADDDILFPFKMIERLYSKWLDFQNCIVCDRGQYIPFGSPSMLNPSKWSSISEIGVNKPSFKILASPGGGCLIPPNALYKDANNLEKISKFALKTGDLWLMFMAIENDTKIIRTHRYHRPFILSEDQQTIELGKEAIFKGGYEKTLNTLIQEYPHAYKNMLRE